MWKKSQGRLVNQHNKCKLFNQFSRKFHMHRLSFTTNSPIASCCCEVQKSVNCRRLKAQVWLFVIPPPQPWSWVVHQLSNYKTGTASQIEWKQCPRKYFNSFIWLTNHSFIDYLLLDPMPVLWKSVLYTRGGCNHGINKYYRTL